MRLFAAEWPEFLFSDASVEGIGYSMDDAEALQRGPRVRIGLHSGTDYLVSNHDRRPTHPPTHSSIPASTHLFIHSFIHSSVDH